MIVDGTGLGINKRSDLCYLIKAKNVLFWSRKMDKIGLYTENQIPIFWCTCMFLINITFLNNNKLIFQLINQMNSNLEVFKKLIRVNLLLVMIPTY